MPGLKIFFAWLLTIVVGSILLPFGVFIWNGDRVLSDYDFGSLFIPIFIFVSALSYMPTLIVLLIVNDLTIRKSLRKQFKYINMTHLIMLVLTLGVGNLWLFLDSYNSSHYSELRMKDMWEEMLAFSSILLLYALVAIPIWILIFKKLWIESREEETQEGSAEDQA